MNCRFHYFFRNCVYCVMNVFEFDKNKQLASMDDANKVTLQLAVISNYISLAITVILVISICYNHLEKSLEFIAIWSIITIAFLGGSCGILAWRLQAIDSFIKWYVLNILYGILWASGTLCIYILFIKRLQLTFYGTKYDISKIVYKTLYFGCTLFIIIFLIPETCYYLRLQDIITVNQYNNIAVVTIVCEQIIDFALSVSLLIIFLQRLRRLNIETGVNHGNVGKDLALNRLQIKIVSSMSKVTILSSVAIVSTQIFLIYIGVLYWLGEPEMLNNIRYALLALDVCINSICVILNFDFANIWYHRLCCCCAYCCNKICAYKARKQMNDLHIRLLSQQYEL